MTELLMLVCLSICLSSNPQTNRVYLSLHFICSSSLFINQHDSSFSQIIATFMTFCLVLSTVFLTHLVKNIKNPVELLLRRVHVAGVDGLKMEEGLSVLRGCWYCCYHHVFQEVNVSTLIFIKNVENGLWQIFGLIAIQIFWDFYEQFLAGKSMSMKDQLQPHLDNHQSLFIRPSVGQLSKPLQQPKINHYTNHCHQHLQNIWFEDYSAFQLFCPHQVTVYVYTILLWRKTILHLTMNPQSSIWTHFYKTLILFQNFLFTISSKEVK